MNSSGPNQSEINSDQAATKPGNVETETRCVYPNERRERKQIYTLLSISNSVNEQEERPLEGVNGTGWEEAVQSWSKTAPFAYLQLQKRTRKSKTSESVNRCLYCLDLTPGVEPEPQNMVQVKSDFKLNPSAASGSSPEKQQTLLSSSSVTTTTPAAPPPSATDEPKRETDDSILHSIQVSQGEKKKMALREAQASLSEKKLFLLKENLLFPAEKKPVPIKEYNILSPGKPQILATLKTKEIKSHEPLLWNRSGTEITAKSSLVLPPLKDTALKQSLDNSAKKSKVVNSQASEKTFHAFAETVSCPQFLKPKQLKCEPTIDAMYDAVVKEQLKMHEIASAFVPRLSKTSLLSRHLDRGYWHFLPDRKSLTLSSSVQLRRHGHLHSSHSLHAKGSHASKANEIRRSYNGGKQEGSQAKSQDIPLLSGLFSSLTEPSWERVTPFICCKTPKQPKKSRITQPTSCLPHQSMSQSLKKNVSRGTNQQPSLDCKFPEGESIASSRKAGVSCFKPYTYIPTMNANPEGERVRGKLDSIQTFLGEKRTLPIKEYEIMYSQQAEQEVLSMPNVSQGHPASSLDCITLNALLVLQPETGVINLHLEPPPKPKAVAVKRSDKGHCASTRVVSRSYAAKEAKEKNQNKVDIDHMVKKQIQKSCTAL